MSSKLNHAPPVTLAILLALGTAASHPRARGTDEVASARTAVLGATEVPRDTPPTEPAKPGGKSFQVSKLEYVRMAPVQCELRPLPWPGRPAQSGSG
jgi:hypothetical protein